MKRVPVLGKGPTTWYCASKLAKFPLTKLPTENSGSFGAGCLWIIPADGLKKADKGALPKKLFLAEDKCIVSFVFSAVSICLIKLHSVYFNTQEAAIILELIYVLNDQIKPRFSCYGLTFFLTALTSVTSFLSCFAFVSSYTI